LKKVLSVYESDKKDQDPPDHKGKLIIDATVAEQAIRHPTDLGLLNESREITEQLIDELAKGNGVRIPGDKTDGTAQVMARCLCYCDEDQNLAVLRRSDCVDTIWIGYNPG